jgi:hypothetical protein
MNSQLPAACIHLFPPDLRELIRLFSSRIALTRCRASLFVRPSCQRVRTDNLTLNTDRACSFSNNSTFVKNRKNPLTKLTTYVECSMSVSMLFLSFCTVQWLTRRDDFLSAFQETGDRRDCHFFGHGQVTITPLAIMVTSRS